MMGYHLLTGATGLLGRYLLKDLSLAGVPMAVLVRPSRRQTVEERVSSILYYWQKQHGYELARPMILEGDICEPDLGLNPAALDWVTKHCEALIHSAASLTFISTSPQSEPWRSNVQGAQNILDLCQRTGIEKLHHVSTAYVCGLRTGRIMESDVDVGQTLGNDYEKSKLQAEKMVRSAEHIKSLTVHRPAIIIGDSKTGFTNTFHGFYAALQLAFMLTKAFDHSVNETGLMGGERVQFKLSGHESKNLIPVDWVSEVMSYVISHPEHHGKTYHLTPLHPVTTRLFRDVLEEVCGSYGAMFLGPDAEFDHPSEPEKLFYEHMQVYNSYWRDDPVFDCTNTLQAAPHLPSPYVNREMLVRLAKIAVDMNFTWSDRSFAAGPRKVATVVES
ncbi:MAG: SDR family oxidoreductase [Planctomycetaceae bacterium]